ncbi:Reticulon [Penicillium coprophilum]|uniref:Reticulon n=1 Tax=Penicillium coprophilum TaxID=36646 RepID=UPI0023A562A5|nr:Reticulon [Penicillium coprophilum]KAJ5169944.1 Reticulon [Penicillium coprophilum]
MASGDVTYPNTGSISDVITKGPIVDNVKSEAFRTGDEFRDLKNSRVTPSTTTADGQPLTHYHSLMHSLLSWEQPRATAVSYASVICFIFAARYLPLLRWAFKFLYMSLGVTATVEIAGQVILKRGIASGFRPRRYYTVPKETVEAVLEDFEQLVDFFLIEFQRILFAENIIHTVLAFTAAFTGYWLIRFIPFWGLAVIAVTTTYFTPLIYISNREIIDEQIANVQEIINSQTNQLRDMAGERTSHATGLMKQYVGEYSSKAHEYIGSRRSTSPEATKLASPVKREIVADSAKTEPIADFTAPVTAPVTAPATASVAEPIVKHEDFHEAPKAAPIAHALDSDIVASVEPAEQAGDREPLLAI